MPPSEIDDIFAGKTRGVSSTSASTSSKAKGKEKATENSLSTISSSESKKKKKKKRKLDDREDGDGVGESILDAKVRVAVDDDASSSKKKKKRKKERDGDVEQSKELESKAPTPSLTPAPPKPKKRVPETVFDPSLSLGNDLKKKPSAEPKLGLSRSKSLKPDKSNAKKSEGGAETEEMKRFKDSRGTGPRKRTEEGYLVYKEDELGIQDEGGETPLCPFDCDCCF